MFKPTQRRYLEGENRRYASFRPVPAGFDETRLVAESRAGVHRTARNAHLSISISMGSRAQRAALGIDVLQPSVTDAQRGGKADRNESLEAFHRYSLDPHRSGIIRSRLISLRSTPV